MLLCAVAIFKFASNDSPSEDAVHFATQSDVEDASHESEPASCEVIAQCTCCYPKETNNPLAADSSNLDSVPTYTGIEVPENFIETIASSGESNTIQFRLSESTSAKGILKRITKDPNDYPIAVEGILEKPFAGRFIFQKELLKGKAWPMSGIVIFESQEIAYRVEPSQTNPSRAQITPYPIDQVICRRLLPPPQEMLSEPQATVTLPADFPTDITIPAYQNGIIPLESRPGLTAVVYLDFDGEEGPHTLWGDFDAAAPTDVTTESIFRVWRRVAEDYAPFQLNITTDLQVYLDAPANSRQRCIVTPTTDAAPNAGGVAYLNTFNSSSEIPCWAFYSTGKAGGEVISHEIGHTLGLDHDGRTNPSEGYYQGHGSTQVAWAPIMGLGYYRTLSQWSKGEYLSANNQEDDISIIANDNNNIGMRPDLHGNTASTAQPLVIQSNNSVREGGYITTETDIDVFSFSTSGGTLSLNVNGENYGPNIDILAQLYDSNNSLVATSNPDTLIDASLSATLSNDTYTLHVSGVGRGDPLAYGYPAYGSLGSYLITGSIEGAANSLEFSINENPTLNQIVGSISPFNNHGSNSITYTITAGNDSGAFSLNSTSGSLTVADPNQFNYEALVSTPSEAASYLISVSITNNAQPQLNESIPVLVTINDLNEAPTISISDTVIPERLRVDSIVATSALQDPDFSNTHTWAILSGNTSNTFQIDSNGSITILNPTTFQQNQNFSLEIQATDSGTPALSTTATLSIEILDLTNDTLEPGLIYRTFYQNISGYSVSLLTTNSKFPSKPDSEKALTEFADGTGGDNYGSTVRAFLIPPYDANYTFWIASDNTSELWLSSSEDPTAVTKRASVDTYTNEKVWDTYPSQQSDPISLNAGQVYYIEARHKENSSGDHLAVAWRAQLAGQTLIPQQVIPATYLAPQRINYSPTISGPASISIRENIYPEKTIAAFSASNLNPNQSSSFQISSGNSNAIFAIDSITGDLTVNKYQALDLSTTYLLDIAASDTNLSSLTDTTQLSIQVIDSNSITATGPIQEVWNSISGTSIINLYNDPDWPNAPDQIEVLNDFEAINGLGDNYGARIQAYLLPPTTGQYTFYFASDDQGSLRLSSNSDPSNATEIASVSGWTQYQEWNKYSEQTSAPITLIAGERYYIDGRFKEGTGGDHLSVAWTGPDFSSITVIANQYLEAYDSNNAPAFNQASYLFNYNTIPTNNTPVTTLTATYQPFENITYTILAGDPNDAFSLNSSTGQLSIRDTNYITSGQIFNLTVGIQDDGYGGILPFKDASVPLDIIFNGTSIQNWRGQKFGVEILNTGISGNLEDPDNDSIINLLEYAFDLDPLVQSSSALLPTFATNGTTLQFTYRKNLNASDLSYTIQQKETLDSTNSWQAAQIQSQETLSQSGNTQIIRATIPLPETTPKGFLRLQIVPTN